MGVHSTGTSNAVLFTLVMALKNFNNQYEHFLGSLFANIVVHVMNILDEFVVIAERPIYEGNEI